MKILKLLFPVIVVLVLSVFTILPFLHSGFFPIHDDTQVARVYEMTKGLSDGMLPVRWVSDLGYGYGYPIFNFYDPLPYYIGGLVELIGVNALLATKIMMVLGIALAGISMYFLASEFWGKSGGVLSALFYMYAPYHALDIYVRGDVAEFWAFAFIPLVFLGLWKIYKQQKWRYVVLSSIAFALIVVSHNLTAMMVAPFLILFSFYLALIAKNKKTAIYLLATFVIGILLSAFYWLPAVLEMANTNVSSLIGGSSSFGDNFVCLNQLWTSPWGYGGSTKGCVDGLSFMIGKYHILLTFLLSAFAILSVLTKKYFKSFSKEKLIIILFSFLGFLTATFFTLQISQPIWELIRPMAFFQYPWRFLVLSVFFASFIVGSLFWIAEKYLSQKIILILLLLLISIGFIFVSVKFFVPEKYLNVNSDYYTNINTLNWKVSKISDEYLPKNFVKPKDLNSIADFSKLNTKNLTVQVINRKTQEVTFNVKAATNQSIILPLAYFPSWQVYVDEKKIPVSNYRGRMSIAIPQGQHSIKLVFQQDAIELLADMLSVAGILALFIGIIHLNKKYA